MIQLRATRCLTRQQRPSAMQTLNITTRFTTKFNPLKPNTSQKVSSTRWVVVRAESDNTDKPTSPSPPSTTTEDASSSTPGLKPGQGTAIITGAISILFGVAYLVLVQVMDRGVMLPPPPEAFGP